MDSYRKRLRPREVADRAITYVLLIIMCFIMCLPLISMFGTSFKTDSDALATTSLFPEAGKWYFQNYIDVIVKFKFGKYILNSLIVSLVAAMGAMVISALAGYALSRYRNWFSTMFIALLLMLQMLPAVLVLVPMFVIYKNLNLVDTLLGLILNYTVSNLGFSIWMLKGFFDGIPRELEEAAVVDGCNRFQAFLRVILPISATGFTTVAIFTFVRCWNEYMVSRILISSEGLKTINLGLQQFTTQYGTSWGMLSAAAAIATIPTLLFLLFAQKYLIQGITAGAVKG